MSLLKKKIQVLLDQKCNDPIQNPIINKLNLRNLIEICLNKNKFSGISSKIELVNEIINFMIYIQLKFKNFSNIAAEYVPTENHLMNSSSIEIYETITNILFSYEKEIKEELDNINTKKKEIENDSKKPNNDKQKEIEGMEIKSNQFLLLIENLKRLQASKN